LPLSKTELVFSLVNFLLELCNKNGIVKRSEMLIIRSVFCYTAGLISQDATKGLQH